MKLSERYWNRKLVRAYETIAKAELKCDAQLASELRYRFAQGVFSLIDQTAVRIGVTRQRRRNLKRKLVKGNGN